MPLWREAAQGLDCWASGGNTACETISSRLLTRTPERVPAPNLGELPQGQSLFLQIHMAFPEVPPCGRR
jgi:hypothetical protein